jgi:hypothetical protein
MTDAPDLPINPPPAVEHPDPEPTGLDLLAELHTWALEACHQGAGSPLGSSPSWHLFLSTWEEADELLPRIERFLAVRAGANTEPDALAAWYAAELERTVETASKRWLAQFYELLDAKSAALAASAEAVALRTDLDTATGHIAELLDLIARGDEPMPRLRESTAAARAFVDARRPDPAP